jgi:hypothetical protein
MRGQPEDIAAAMMRSLELGIDPLDGLANLHVIKGKVGYSAEFMRRRILEAGHELIVEESTDDRCKVRGRRNGSQEWQTATFTADQARKAKINLGDYPADKLVARASSRLCRRAFPDVLAGATIIEDVIDVDGEEIKPAESLSPSVARKRAPRKVAAKPPASPPSPQPEHADIDDLLDDETTAAVFAIAEALAQPAPNSEPQPAADPTRLNRRMHVLFGKADCPDREDRLIVTRHIIGSEVSSSNELSAEQLQKLVDQLGQWERAGKLGQRITDILNQWAIRTSEAEAQE